MPKRWIAVLCALPFIAAALLIAGWRPAVRTPGPQRDGTILLPNGWTISPAGRALSLGPGALTMAQSPDGKQLAVLHCGADKHWVALVDVETERMTERVDVEHAWLGIAYHPKQPRLFVSGGGSRKVWDIELGSPSRHRDPLILPKKGFVSGVAVSPDGSALFAGTVDTGEVFRFDLDSGQTQSVPTMGRVYGLTLSEEGDKLFVSDWLRSRVLVYSAKDLKPLDAIPVGPHPNALAMSLDNRLFVTCAADNSVYVIDPGRNRVTERVRVSVHPLAPEGSCPTDLAFSPDGQRLYVAVADNNCVAVVDISERGQTELLGFIPTGWYTCAVSVSRSGRKLMALASKGAQPKANSDRSYIARLLTSEVRFVDVPDERSLRRMTARVVQNSPYRDSLLRAAVPVQGSVLPSRPGDPSPIRYVIYVIKENRTYDQVFGDMPQGRGDPSLCIYGEAITPNQHKLAREFALLDNFYVDAEVSADGHNWSTAAYANDYVEKRWPYGYGGHGGGYDYEGTNPLSRPRAGYIWDAARRAGVSYRSYGEFVEEERQGTSVVRRASVPSLEGHFCPNFPSYNLQVKDVDRVAVWLEEFRRFEKEGEMPRLQIVRLPQNHTSGTRPGAWTPRAMVADNDLALGQLVEAVTHSKFWRQTAIFVLEDDAQNGPDHVDAHRSVCLVISPYSRLRVTDSNLYTTCSVLRTIQLLLGLQPLNQYDAAAAPMYSLFRGKPNTKPYKAVANRVSTDERNPENAVMARESLALNLEECDAMDMALMNRVLWADAKGPGVPYPVINRTSVGLLSKR